MVWHVLSNSQEVTWTKVTMYFIITYQFNSSTNETVVESSV